MRRIDFQITPEEDGMKVERYLKSVRGMSSRVIISLKHRPEGLLLNGAHIRTVDLIHAGDTLSVTMEDTPPDYLESEIRVPVLYEDEHVLAIDKPHFLPTTPRGSYIAQTALTRPRPISRTRWPMSLPGTAGSGVRR